jgi:hypothetical protein
MAAPGLAVAGAELGGSVLAALEARGADAVSAGEYDALGPVTQPAATTTAMVSNMTAELTIQPLLNRAAAGPGRPAAWSLEDRRAIRRGDMPGGG